MQDSLRLIVLLVPLLVLGVLRAEVRADAARGSKPNIVIIYADDLGYGDVSCYNPQRGKIATPHIDRLAGDGIRFTNAHSSSSVCSPSRYTLLTGRYHWRTRLQKGIVDLWERPLLAEDRLTLPGMLKQQGYRTACIGKWHLGWTWAMDPQDKASFKAGGYGGDKAVTATEADRQAWRRLFSQRIGGGPVERGFDSYFGTDCPNWPPFCFIENDRTVGIPSEYLPAAMFEKNLASRQGPALEGWKLEPVLPTLADRAVAFITEAAGRDEPYMLYLPLTSPHTPIVVSEEWKGRSGLNAYADFVMQTDAVVGRVLEAIDRSGEADRTIVIFSSDNGCAPYAGAAELEKMGHYPSGPLRGYKFDVWEGGTRMPMIVRWPEVVKAGRVSGALVHQADVMATCAEIVGAKLPADAGEDSFSMMGVLEGKSEKVRELAVTQSGAGVLAIRRGDWKLVFGKGPGGSAKDATKDAVPGQLYHLADDLGETNNLYRAQPQIVADLQAAMKALIDNGRSTPGPKQPNDVPVKWKPAGPVTP